MSDGVRLAIRVATMTRHSRPDAARLACWVMLCAAALCGTARAQSNVVQPEVYSPAGNVVAQDGFAGVEEYADEYDQAWDVSSGDPACGDCVEEYPLLLDPLGPWRHKLGQRLRLRHSSTHGRYTGRGRPLEGTSWLNRPYYLGVAGGGLFMASAVEPNVRRDNDLYGQFHAGWDFDHYWAGEWRVGRATPELINSTQLDAVRDDRYVITDLSLIYYPWGDTQVRPYFRAGVGLTSIDYINDSGDREGADLYTLPIGYGMKWMVKRWLAGRIELVDNVAIGENNTATQHNFVLTLGFEYHFGAKPKSYWPWNPARHLY